MINYTLEDILNAIKDSAGLVSVIARKLNCAWHTAKGYIESCAETREAFLDEIEKNKDKAESIILKKLNEEDGEYAKWYLRTIGKDRGYNEKTEMEHSGGLNIVIDLPDDLKENDD